MVDLDARSTCALQAHEAAAPGKANMSPSLQRAISNPPATQFVEHLPIAFMWQRHDGVNGREHTQKISRSATSISNPEMR